MTEHVEGDPCKFALWSGRTPSSDNKTVLKVSAALLWALGQGCGKQVEGRGLQRVLPESWGLETLQGGQYPLGIKKQVLSWK